VTPLPPTNVILFRDDGDIDHLHKSDNDEDKEDGAHRVVEMKLIIAPSSAIVKVEKDWWSIDAMKKVKRIAWHTTRDTKDSELADANRKIIELQ